MKSKTDWFYNILIQYDIATKDEIDLVTIINGNSEETLLDILYARTGCSNFNQFLWNKLVVNND